MIKSNFDFEILKVEGRDIIKIVDLNFGNRSVTNDIENVVTYIALQEKINPEGYLIVYQDSEGWWDGWDVKDKAFVYLNGDSFEQALAAYTRLINKSQKV